ncbi:MAG: MotA/TolQ/ExbB proton channel family protein [Rhizobiaceae bacterium]|jgi:biopolymer transport protein ExbB/TolQ|nr:MotA/TolQ/ExbB proton channel family protein [Rhizobiaceae bacterium]
MTAFEVTLYEISRLFLLPVLTMILLSLAYGLIAFGMFLAEAVQRRRATWRPTLGQTAASPASDDLELEILRRTEWLRIVSRAAPMLGLVATMIPMGPALLALGRNDAIGVADNLVVAFSAVILALVAASLCFLVLTVRRRWLMTELRAFERESL